MPWVCELVGHNPAAGVEGTLLFALGNQGLALIDGPYIEGGLTRWASPTQKVDVAREGPVVLSGDTGQIVISNRAQNVLQPGPWDHLRLWAWHGRTARLYYLPGAIWAARILVARATMQQPVGNLATDGSLSSNLTFPLRDPRAALAVPLQTKKFAGNNNGGPGIQGEADLKNKPLPIVHGVVSNIPGVLVDRNNLIYCLSDNVASVLCVRDGGQAYTASTQRANVASLLANDPPPGRYDTYAGAEGTYVKLGSAPRWRLTFDAQSYSAPLRNHARLWERFHYDRVGTLSAQISEANVAAFVVTDPEEVGWWWSEEMTKLDAMNEILASFSGFEVQNLNGTWTLHYVTNPGATTKYDLVQNSRGAQKTLKTRTILSLNMVRPTYMPDGVPPYRVNVHWGRNYTLMAPGDFAHGANARLKDKFAQEWRTESATDLSIWNPTTKTGPWTEAPELNIYTGYQPGVDGVTAPHVQAYAQNRLAVYSAMKPGYEVEFVPDIGDSLAPGDVISITHPQMDMGSGRRFLVLQANLVVESELPKIRAVVGFQT